MGLFIPFFIVIFFAHIIFILVSMIIGVPMLFLENKKLMGKSIIILALFMFPLSFIVSAFLSIVFLIPEIFLFNIFSSVEFFDLLSSIHFVVIIGLTVGHLIYCYTLTNNYFKELPIHEKIENEIVYKILLKRIVNWVMVNFKETYQPNKF